MVNVGKYTVRPMDPISKYTEFRGADDIHDFLVSFVARASSKRILPNEKQSGNNGHLWNKESRDRV